MISTGQQLWSTWVESGALKPETYDADLRDAILAETRAQGVPRSLRHVPDAVAAANWDARELLRFMMPRLESFAALLFDLLAFYQRIGAQQADEANLRIQYEFESGVVHEDSLRAFAERSERIATTLAAWPRFVFTGYPMYGLRQSASIRSGSGELPRDIGLRMSDGAPGRNVGSIPSAWQRPTPTGDQSWDTLIEGHRHVVEAFIGVATKFGSDAAEMFEHYYRIDPNQRNDADLRVITATGDGWILDQIGRMHQIADAVRLGTMRSKPAQYERWLSQFWDRTPVVIEQLKHDVTDILSLPDWGRRHALYAAWVLSCMDRGIRRFQPRYHLQDGVLRFPFKETHLASLETARGTVELWSEVRSPAPALIGHGRTSNIQPDYRFIRRIGEVTATDYVVEVKQYAKASAVRHRETLIDYLTALPAARVALIGHGPLGKYIAPKLPSPLRGRASVREDVRPGRPLEIAMFHEEVVEVLGPSVSRLSGEICIDLTWDEDVHDLDIWLVGEGKVVNYLTHGTTFAQTHGENFGGGPERATVAADRRQDVEIEVHLYERGALRPAEGTFGVRSANPRVRMTSGAVVIEIVPRQSGGHDPSPVWAVGTVGSDGTLTIAEDSEVVGHEGRWDRMA